MKLLALIKKNKQQQDTAFTSDTTLSQTQTQTATAAAASDSPPRAGGGGEGGGGATAEKLVVPLKVPFDHESFYSKFISERMEATKNLELSPYNQYKYEQAPWHWRNFTSKTDFLWSAKDTTYHPFVLKEKHYKPNDSEKDHYDDYDAGILDPTFA